MKTFEYLLFLRFDIRVSERERERQREREREREREKRYLYDLLDNMRCFRMD